MCAVRVVCANAISMRKGMYFKCGYFLSATNTLQGQILLRFIYCSVCRSGILKFCLTILTLKIGYFV